MRSKVAVQGALAAVYVPTHHNPHVGFGISSSGGGIIKGHLCHDVDSALPVENIELVSSGCNCYLFGRKFGA